MKNIIKTLVVVMALVLALVAFTGCEFPGTECTHEGYETVGQSVDPTCTETGSSGGVYCSNCNAVISEAKVWDALGHEKTEAVGTTATCTEAGVETWKCGRCGETYELEVEAYGHELADVKAKAATCTEDGYNAHKACVNCDYTEGKEVATAPGHALVDVPAKEATLEEDGYTAHKVCENCDYIEGKEIVKLPIISSAFNADHFDLTGLNNETPVVKSNGMVNSFAAFAGEASKYYVATVTAKITATHNDDTWSRVGISHFNGTNSYYGFQVSPGPNLGEARKTVTMVITDGNVQWGEITDRSQVWWQHDQGALDYSNVTITVVRNGNAFYAYLNGELYWVDEYMNGFSDIDTLPVINVGSASAEFTNMGVAYGEEAVAAFLAEADNSKFYRADDKTTFGEDGSITFTGAADNSCTLNAKDHAAKSIGTSAVLGANVSTKVEFDLTINYFGGRDGLPALAVTLNRYEGYPAEARSLVIGQYKAGWTGWNSNGNLNEGIGSGGVEYMANGETVRLEEGQTYHVVFIRVMTANGQDTRMIITDKDGNVLIDHQHGWADTYSGRAVVSFLCRDVDCTISNIQITEVQ